MAQKDKSTMCGTEAPRYAANTALASSQTADTEAIQEDRGVKKLSEC